MPALHMHGIRARAEGTLLGQGNAQAGVQAGYLAHLHGLICPELLPECLQLSRQPGAVRPCAFNCCQRPCLNACHPAHAPNDWAQGSSSSAHLAQLRIALSLLCYSVAAPAQHGISIATLHKQLSNCSCKSASCHGMDCDQDDERRTASCEQCADAPPQLRRQTLSLPPPSAAPQLCQSLPSRLPHSGPSGASAVPPAMPSDANASLHHHCRAQAHLLLH